MATSRIADHVGRVLGGRYRLIGPVGTGASAHVFVADDVVLRRRVAVKVLHAALADDEAFLRRFRAEAQQAAALNHPNIMRVYDWGESDDGPYLVLELLGGGSLRDLLDAGHLLSPSQALLVGLEAARALDYAHRRGLVHRDIKPANLLFDDEGRLCVADFGLARALAEAAWTEPAGAVLGTARYASPEQAQGLSVDGKSDVYALALVLVESVTGAVPFTADTTIATLMARVGTRLEPDPSLGPLGPVLQQAAAPDPAERLEARRLAMALDGAASQLPAPEPLPLPSPEAEGEPTIVIEPDSGDATELGLRPRLYDDDAVMTSAGAGPRRRWPIVVVLALLVAALAGGSAYAIVQARVPRHPVPSLRGKTMAQARTAVTDEDFDVEVAEERFDETAAKGLILEQDPSLGKLREGSDIKVVVSKGARPRDVPDLTGLDQAAAEQRLKEAGFAVKVALQVSEDVPKGTVLDWAPRGRLAKGTEILVTVSDGPPLREVPDLSGLTFEEAAAQLGALGLKAVKAEVFSDDVEKGKVVSTKPAQGSKVPRDGSVTVNISKGPDIVTVPDVRGRTVDEAKAMLQSAGLQFGRTYGPPRASRVIDSTPSAGSQVRRGTVVDLFVK